MFGLKFVFENNELLSCLFFCWQGSYAIGEHWWERREKKEGK